jgi:GNAT superfamily N-acetyltransferase
MTISAEPGSPSGPGLVVRDYAEGDYPACRSLWAELTEHHRRIYEDPSIGGDDPGAEFDDYLARPDRVRSWVAVSDGQVIGLAGLLDRGASGEVEPVVVTTAARGQGVGQRLISRVADAARAQGYEYLAIRPVARNIAAIHRFHAAGFRALGGHVDLTMDLAARRHSWRPGVSLHGLDFGY